ncbi:hypothetical protein V6Z64_14855 [Leptospira borgpetersenii]|nr:hypothetical protein [Leptospira borgpetersenii]
MPSCLFDFERVPKPFDLIGILADRCNCSYVLGPALYRGIHKIVIIYQFKKSSCNTLLSTIPLVFGKLWNNLFPSFVFYLPK